MSTQLQTEISNDPTCDKFISRVILAKLDDTHLSKQRSDVEYRENQKLNLIFGNIDAKNFRMQRLKVQHGETRSQDEFETMNIFFIIKMHVEG